MHRAPGKADVRQCHNQCAQIHRGMHWLIADYPNSELCGGSVTVIPTQVVRDKCNRATSMHKNYLRGRGNVGRQNMRGFEKSRGHVVEQQAHTAGGDSATGQ